MMLTEHDIQALIELLRRTPMTKPEQLFAGRLINVLANLAREGNDEKTNNVQSDSVGCPGINDSNSSGRTTST